MFVLRVVLGILAVTFAERLDRDTQCPIQLYENISPKLEGSFRGGTKADITSHPYQATILHFERHYCSATILSKYTVVTAAHCIFPWLRMSLDQYYIRVGSNILQEPGQEVGIGHFVTHEKYQHGETFDYDIALVFVSEPFTHPNAVPVKLPRKSTLYHQGQEATMTGYTKVPNSDPPSHVLHAAHACVIDNRECQSKFRTLGQLITDDFWCAATKNNVRGSCAGLSGSGAIIDGELAGVVMFGPGCIERGSPGLYVSVPRFLDWLDEHGGFEEVL